MGEGLKRARAAAKRSRDAVKAAKQLAADERAAPFLALLKHAGLPIPEREWQFDPARKWKADYAWPFARLILEVEGGVWSGGRHTRGAGFLKDMEKYNRMTALGWRLLRTTPDQLATLATVELLRSTLTPQDTRP